MQYDLKKMKAEYDKKPITECVGLVKKFNDEMIQRGEQLVGLLWYLEKTKRYKEYDGYKKLDFKVFVWEACHITYNRYRELAYAYNWFPVEAKELGPHTIQMIRDRVGVTNMPKVLSEIKSAVSDVKNPEKKREVIGKVVDKHSPPKTKAKGNDNKAYWKAKFEAKEKECIGLKKEIKAYVEQIKRLKETVTRLTAEIDFDEPEKIPSIQLNA
jgi:hypothetical protein